MLATMLTVMFFVVRAAEQLGSGWFRQQPVPYMVYQPLPWQVQYVSQNRRGSKVDEKDGGSRRNSAGDSNKGSSSGVNGQWSGLGPASPEKAAVTIQTQYRKYQQRKQKGSKH
ncbi:uncharacterized protein LOC136755093 [Amia ocellicauda]|uniref:uncharacterized protein LOC136755093 n=1 Tax=Amia ocellicauda TaxID=2972642 RepID=UPI003464937A